MEILTLKDDLLSTLGEIDKSKLSLMDLRLYADTLKVAPEIQTKSYVEMVADAMRGIHAPYSDAAALSNATGGD